MSLLTNQDAHLAPEDARMIAAEVVRELATTTRRRVTDGGAFVRDALDVTILAVLGLSVGFLIAGILPPWIETETIVFGPMQIGAGLAVIAAMLANLGLRATLRRSAGDHQDLQDAAARASASALLARRLLDKRGPTPEKNSAPS